MKRICLVNGLSLIPPLSGVGRVVFELCRRVFNSNETWTPLYYYGYYSHSLLTLDAPGESGKNFKSKMIKTAFSAVRSNPYLKRTVRTALDAFAVIGRPDKNETSLYWEPNHVTLETLEAKHKLLTIHDLSCLLYPQWHPRERLDFFSARFLPGVERADVIVTVSRSIRREVIERLSVPEDKVLYVHNGVDHDLFRPLPEDRLAEFRARARLPERYVLCVGALEPRKNLLSLLDAWSSLPERVSGGHKLLLVANSGWENQEIMRKIREGKESVLLRTDVSTWELPYYYNLAELFVYVSLYEGFGLPPVEAMACGTPVLASDIAAHREVLGDAVAYVTPSSSKAIAECLEALLTAPLDKSEASERGVRRASRYSWEKSACRYRAIMQNFSAF
jgi:glycosyltransferase involved in cell wall biosynthesis